MKAFIVAFILLVSTSAWAGFTVNVMSTPRLQINKRGAGTYTDASPDWRLVEFPKYSVNSTTTTTATFVFPATTTQTRSGGSETMSITYVCRMSTTPYPAKTDGSACTPSINLTAGVPLYISLIPVSATFTGNVSGDYLGTPTISVY